MDRKQKDCGDYKFHSLADRPVRRATKSTYVIRSSVLGQPSRSGTQRSCDRLLKDLYSCEECRKQINLWKSRRKRQRPHKCWAYLCKAFKDCVEIDIHKCFMQPVGEEECSNDVGLPAKRPCHSRAPRRASHAVVLLDRNLSSENYSEENNWEEANRAKL